MSSKEEEREQQSKSSIRIVDRRRFDSAGDEKGEDSKISSTAQDNTEVKSNAASNPAPVAAKTPVSESSAESEQQAKEAEKVKAAYNAASADFTMRDSNNPESADNQSEGQESEISFGSFVLSLATQALMQLGQLQAPDGMSIPVDPASAKQTIDILGVLQDKTKGNLDVREEGLLRDALHSLRLAFLRFR